MSEFIHRNAVVLDWCFIPDQDIQALIKARYISTEFFRKHSVIDLTLLRDYYHPEYDGPSVDTLDDFDGKMLRFLKQHDIDVAVTPVFIHVWW
jgi:hypothetical protein